MASSRVLTPPLTDPAARQAERLASLEARLAALEARRDLKITPLGSFSASGGTQSSKQYHWDGGRLWIMWWGQIVELDGFTGAVGIDLVLNTTPLGVLSAVTINGASPNTSWNTRVATQLLGPAAFWTPGQDNTIGMVRSSDNNVDSWVATGLMFEWPQA